MPRKNRPDLFDLPSLELECMKALWSLGEATVHEIREALLPTRPLAYTTVMTVMDRLAHKAVVQRSKRGRAHVYSSAIAQASVRDHAVERLVENFFGGSREELRSHLGGLPAAEIKPPAPRPIGRPSPHTGRKPQRPAPPVSEEIDPSLL